MQIKSAKGLKLRVLTHNIRYAANPPSKGEAPWNERLPDLLTQFRYQTRYAPQTIICLQEVLDHQLVDLLRGLNKDGDEWASIGVGRDDGIRDGEYVPILYQPSIWRLEHFEYFWLSQTPDRPSLGWDAGSKRVITIGVFRHKETSRPLVAMNTHLDNAGSEARRNGAKLILNAVNSFTKGDHSGKFGPLPVFLAGDMNSQEDQEAYKVFTSKESPLRDAKSLAPPGYAYGYVKTFTGFNGHGDEDGELTRLDYVFVTQEAQSSWTTYGYATLPNIFEDASGKYLSDHRAVVADIELGPS
ncbi:endonuclease/exonuclease/phosphatase [Myriangium duriaei CBS 260.36]|uniref:Endonuclease/exonuclease/phosphatase n=1 Tax=Myriangium duriaei CBS 260.36 TaxID=1168546 RepID=A0A9P4J2Y7_9PEZI|nr:endonuclease/exonuclease/phosphatase [Myriangium duriaei CBS 260.36]